MDNISTEEANDAIKNTFKELNIEYDDDEVEYLLVRDTVVENVETVAEIGMEDVATNDHDDNDSEDDNENDNTNDNDDYRIADDDDDVDDEELADTENSLPPQDRIDNYQKAKSMMDFLRRSRDGMGKHNRPYGITSRLQS